MLDLGKGQARQTFHPRPGIVWYVSSSLYSDLSFFAHSSPFPLAPFSSTSFTSFLPPLMSSTLSLNPLLLPAALIPWGNVSGFPSSFAEAP